MSVLVVMTGLPCSGKSSVARAVARSTPAAYLSVDPVHGALDAFGIDEWDPIGKAPYAVVRRLAEVQLKVGVSAVVDAVNPFESIRSDYRHLAADQNADCVVVSTTCSDAVLHQRRVATRHAAGNPVDWVEVERQARYYEAPAEVDVVVDAIEPLEANVAKVLEAIDTSFGGTGLS